MVGTTRGASVESGAGCERLSSDALVDFGMVQIDGVARNMIHDSLMAASLSIGRAASACHSLRAMPEAKAIHPQLDLSIARLAAMRRDLDHRLQAGDSQDNLFIALQVIQAGLSSVTDALGEMLQDYAAVQPRVELQQGWFTPEDAESVELHFRPGRNGHVRPVDRHGATPPRDTRSTQDA
jgi:hypothetical protein